jgi:hypothetical protein
MIRLLQAHGVRNVAYWHSTGMFRAILNKIIPPMNAMVSFIELARRENQFGDLIWRGDASVATGLRGLHPYCNYDAMNCNITFNST